MFFVAKSTSPTTDLAIYRTKRKARLYLTLHNLGTSEILLSRYLQENYNMTLKSACLAILQESRYNLNIQREIIITIPNPKLNTIAKIITYGTGRVPGSHILQNMFKIN